MDTTFTMGAMDIMSILCIQKKVLQQEQLLVSFSCAVSVHFVFSAQNAEIMRNKLRFMLWRSRNIDADPVVAQVILNMEKK